jgi:hypothetical protein
LAIGMQEYNKIKNELTGLGYSMKYVDEWQPKTRLYRHKAAYNVEGVLTDEVGTYTDNVPGDPRYLLRKAKIGMFGFPPSEACTCKWCKERNETQVVAKTKVVESAPESGAPVAPIVKGNRRMGPYYEP